jgi:hypothetical protein
MRRQLLLATGLRILSAEALRSAWRVALERR